MSFQGSSTPVVPITGADFALSDGGYLYTAVAPTPGTGIIGPVSTTFDTTKALLSIYNGGSLNITLKGLRLHVGVVGTTGSIVQFTQTTDTGNRWSSGGTALTANNTNSGSLNRSGAVVNFGALTLTTATASRTLAHTKYKSAIEVVDDTYQFSWGSSTQYEDPASLINNTTTLSHVSYSFPSITVAPGTTYMLHQWRASITVGVTFDVELAFVEK